MIEYDRWANEEILDAMRGADVVPRRARLWLPHIIGSQNTWVCRLEGTESPVPIWPDWSLDETALHLGALYTRWSRYLNQLPAPNLLKPVAYTNNCGEAYSGTPADILQHVLVHSRHYRSEIAAEIRAANRTPVISDFVFALRDPDFRKTVQPLS